MKKLLILLILCLFMPLSLMAKVHAKKEKHLPYEPVIEKANAEAQQVPDKFGFVNSIMVYDWQAGKLYQVVAAPLRITDIHLEPAETLMGEPVCGDTVRWIIARTKSMGDKPIEHIYIKPTRGGLTTTLSINTNLRTYYIELHSTDGTYMASVGWNYEATNTESTRIYETTHSAVTGINGNGLNFQYKLKTKGKCDNWKPVRIYDDGRKTFIEFPENASFHESPILFVVGINKDLQLVNFRKVGNLFIVDRLFDKAELREGQNAENRVIITKITKKEENNATSFFDTNNF